jgi:LacI family transcriptional regulator
VADQLRQEIARGQHRSGQLPSVRQLAGRFGCSTIVISGALDVLQEEGLLERRRGKGVFVVEGVESGERGARPARSGNLALVSKMGQAALIEDTYYSEVWAGMLHAAAAGSCRLTATPLEKGAARAGALRTAEDIPLDGFILLGISEERTVREIMSIGLPVVLADHHLPGLEVDCVDLDSASGSETAVRHLVELGHRQIGYMGNVHPEYNPDRYRGYLRGLESAGLRADDRFLLRGRANLEGGYELMRAALAAGRQLPTAFLSFGSTMVVGAMRALEESGLRVPQDLSLLACGSRWFANAYPAVTVVAAEAHMLGIEAVRALLHRVENPQAPARCRMLPMELLVRETTAAPRGAAGGDSSPRKEG